MRVLLADDHPEVRSALRLLLDQEPDISVVGEAAELRTLISLTSLLRPNLLLLDWALLGSEDGFPPGHHSRGELLEELRMLCPGLRVMALSGRPEVRSDVLAAGADAFVSKGDPPERLLQALRSIEIDCGEMNRG